MFSNGFVSTTKPVADMPVFDWSGLASPPPDGLPGLGCRDKSWIVDFLGARAMLSLPPLTAPRDAQPKPESSEIIRNN